ncbi:hypothetical protein BIU89_12290 [Curtobacterium sp. MCBA15_005]|nr:hypothetical protein BIU89_12290 [Curtobacterium sp. MCBA15_005]
MLGSSTWTLVSVSWPLLVSTYEYGMRSPTSVMPLSLTSIGVPAVIFRVTLADAPVVEDESFEVATSCSFAVTVAVLTTALASEDGAVAVIVKVVDDPAARNPPMH